jgi:hypothetical protein
LGQTSNKTQNDVNIRANGAKNKTDPAIEVVVCVCVRAKEQPETPTPGQLRPSRRWLTMMMMAMAVLMDGGMGMADQRENMRGGVT